MVLDCSSVVQVMVTPVVVRLEVAIAEITGGAVPVVEKVAFGDVVDPFELFTEVTAKSYIVPGVNPVMVTECEVTMVLLSGVCVP